MTDTTPHWSARYIGQPFSEANCAQFAAQVRREIFGQVVRLPAKMPTFAGHQDKAIAEAVQADYAAPTDTPLDGDAVLLFCQGRLRHVGVYCCIAGQGYVLHAMQSARQVVLHRLRDLSRVNMRVEGFYRWL